MLRGLASVLNTRAKAHQIAGESLELDRLSRVVAHVASIRDPSTFATARLPCEPDVIQFGLNRGRALELHFDVPAALVQRTAHGVELVTADGALPSGGFRRSWRVSPTAKLRELSL